MRDAVAWSGRMRFDVMVGRRAVSSTRMRNMVTDAGLDALVQLLNGVTSDLGIRYLAVGSSATPPDASDTRLGAETFRKIVTGQEHVSSGKVRTTLYLAPDEAVGHIREVGVFAGSAATSTRDSGVLIARVLYDHEKTSLESITIVRTDEIGRG